MTQAASHAAAGLEDAAAHDELLGTSISTFEELVLPAVSDVKSWRHGDGLAAPRSPNVDSLAKACQTMPGKMFSCASRYSQTALESHKPSFEDCLANIVYLVKLT